MSPVRSVTYVSRPDLEKIGGADGIRTHDLLDAIEARSQLRHGPTELPKVYHRSIPPGGQPDAFSLSNLQRFRKVGTAIDGRRLDT
jgi:hypothetical protein